MLVPTMPITLERCVARPERHARRVGPYPAFGDRAFTTARCPEFPWTPGLETRSRLDDRQDV